jgi:predicted enzyme related to lactoylglutathione lyase
MSIAVRYLVHDVDQSISFYRDLLGFKLEQQFGPAMAIMSHGPLTLWLAGPMSSAAQKTQNGEKPEPGGWSRFVFVVEDIDAMSEKLKNAGARFKGSIVQGPAGRQVVIEDPSANKVELYQPN